MEEKQFLEFGSFRVDLARLSLLQRGQMVSLPAKAFDVLLILLQRCGDTVTKDELMKSVWPDTFVEEGNLTQTIFVLRKALGDSDGQGLIVTVPRQGYRFTANVTAIAPKTEQLRAVPVPIPHAVSVGAIRWRIRWMAAAVAIGSALAGWIIARVGPQPDPGFHLMRFTVEPPDNTDYREGRVSPDGRWLAFIGIDQSGTKQLWVRRLDSLTARSLVRAEFTPFWSPDSRFIAFGQDGKLKRIAVTGGPPQAICDAALIVGGSWNRDGMIIFAGSVTGVGNLEILQVPAKGGAPKNLTIVDAQRGEEQHTFPAFLPDGRHFVYTIQSVRTGDGGIYLGSLTSPNDRNRLLQDVSNAEFAPATSGNRSTGYLLFARGGILMAQAFDTGELQLRGEPVSLEKIPPRAGIPGGSFSASRNGLLLISAPLFGNQMTWFDRTGRRLGTIGDPGLHLYAELSPDEQMVVADTAEPVTFSPHVWLFPLHGAPTRFALSESLRPLWAPDGKSIAWESINTALYLKTFAGTDNDSLLLEAANLPDDGRLPCDWSRDGRFLIYSETSAGTGFDLWKLPLASRKPTALVRSNFNEYCGALSPDGRWIAYASDESGASEMYVQSLPDEGLVSGRRWQVSYNGGKWPKWRRDGKELLYLDRERNMVALDVKTGATFEAGAPHVLFPTGIHTPDARFDVTSNGQRFIIPTEAIGKGIPPAIILNWAESVKP